MSERTRCCCNCRHNMRCDQPEGIQCFCEIDGHWMGYIETMTGWCKRWASDEKEWKNGRLNQQTGGN